MKKLYLHIGTHKTGSTFIQNSLVDSSEKMKSENIIFLQLSLPKLREITNSYSVNETLIKECREYLQKCTRRYSDKFSFVMSFEGFSGCSKQGYNNSVTIAEMLCKMTEGFNVNIIAYLRRQDTFMESLYAQFIQGGDSFSFSEFLDLFDDNAFNWNVLLENYKKYFKRENIIVRPYDKKYLPQQASIIEDFARIIGSKHLQKTTSTGQSSNASYTRDALEIARLCNPLIERCDRVVQTLLLQATSSKQPFEKYTFFTFQERKNFLKKYELSNQMVSREYFSVPNQFLLLEEENDAHEQIYPGLTLESVCKVLSQELVYIYKNRPRKLISLEILENLEDFTLRWLNRAPWIKRLIKKIIDKDRTIQD